MIIAVQGVSGCFSEQAALRLRPGALVAGQATFAGIFDALAAGAADRGLVPVENTLAGPIAETQALVRERPVEIEDEIQLRIEHCLILHPEGSPAQVKRILSHPVALQQCGHFLAEHVEWKVVPFFDTAGSVDEIMRSGATDAAAVASARAAEVYGARLELRDIGDQSNNFTRFLLVVPRRGRVIG